VRRATELQPAFVQGRCRLGFLLNIVGRHDEADEAFEAAHQLDPIAAYPLAMAACAKMCARQLEQAEAASDQASSFDREHTLALWCSGVVKVATGKFDEGIAALDRAARLSRRRGFFLGVLGWGLAAAGRQPEARAVLDELRRRPPPAPAVVPEAWILAALGEEEAAWEVLRRAAEESQAMLYLAGMPSFDPLRTDPRMAALLERLGLSRLP